MISLCIQTSTSKGSVAICEANQTLFEASWQRPKGRPRRGEKFLSHSEQAGLEVENGLRKCKLKLSDIDIFMTSTGPGSFTGIRVGLAMAKCYSMCTQKPIFAIDSLKLHAVPALDQDLPIAVLHNAYKNQVYLATFRKSKERHNQLVCALEPMALEVSMLGNFIKEPHLCLGDGALVYSNQIPANVLPLLKIDNSIERLHPLASDLHRYWLTLDDKSPKFMWTDLMPLYLRSSEAEEKLEAGLLKPVQKMFNF